MSKNKSVQHDPPLKKIIIIGNNPLDSKKSKKILLGLLDSSTLLWCNCFWISLFFNLRVKKYY